MTKDEIIELIHTMDSSAIAEMKLKDGEFELELKKQPEAKVSADPIQRDPQENTAAAEKGQLVSDVIETIDAPIVGTFYRSASPDSPPYVEDGQEVAEGETLCIIEAMKVMNELEAEFPCRILRVLVENQQMVEYGTPLFEIERLS